MKRSQLVVQLFTVRDFVQTAEDLEQTLRKIKQIGYSGVQVNSIGPIEPAKVKELTDKFDLAICATHISFERLKHDLEAVIQEHRLWNCKYIGLSYMPDIYQRDKTGYLSFIHNCNEIARRLADAGMQFVYHNHRFEFEKMEGVTGLDLLLQESSPKFGFELDTYWVQSGGANPVDWIRKLKGRMQIIHLKDMAVVKNNQVFAEIGEGNLDWPSILQACRDIGMEWYIVEQDECLRNPFESLEISMNYLLRHAVSE